MKTRATSGLLLGLNLGLLFALFLPSTSGPQSAAPAPAMSGQSATLLPDGRWLRVGGEGRAGALAAAEIFDPHSGTSVRLTPKLQHARSWHSATVLPDGRVLIFGGIGSDGHVVDSVERFDPTNEAFELLTVTGLIPRAGHTATLLTDGRLLIVGGVSAAGGLVEGAELWDPEMDRGVPSASLTRPRSGHTAALLPSGEVLVWGGLDAEGSPVNAGELYDPDSARFTPVQNSPEPATSELRLVASLPEDGAMQVPTDAMVALRFSTPMRVETVTPESVVLSGPRGLQTATVSAAEGGMLAFLIPASPLEPGATYTVTLSDLTDGSGRALPLARIRFTTESPVSGDHPGDLLTSGSHRSPRTAHDAAGDDADDWLPAAQQRGDWRTGFPPSPWQSLPPLEAPAGVTALAGQALTLKGEPLPDVTLAIGGGSVRTDTTGRFLLQSPAAGPQEMVIDGRPANRPGHRYGVFEVGVTLAAGRTTVLPYTIWMPRLDTAHAVTIPSPTTTEVVLTTPKIPGLEVRIPPGTVIRDHEGRVVTELSITPVPVDRPPFALARNVEVPVYFTIQPGGAYISGPSGVRVIYPNAAHQLPGQRYNFWRYEPSEVGWRIYGLATVSDDGRRIVPEPGVAIYEFTGAMVNTGSVPPDTGAKPGTKDARGGDPVDLGTGLFILEKTDLFVPDTIPIALTRTYRHRDRDTRPFGVGASHPYAVFLWSGNAFQEANLVLPDGSRVHYTRISPGIGFADAVFEHTETTTAFFKSRIVWNGNGWDLARKDGTVYVFGENAPLQAIRDRFGNQLVISHANGQTGNVTKVTSPNRRWLAFTYDANNRITQTTDNLGRTVRYTYDALSQLTTVTDPQGRVTRYTYEIDGSNRMITLTDPRGIVFLTNYYDQNRVARQTQADGTLYQFAYTLDANGTITQTNVTDPRGNIRRLTFNLAGYALTDTRALAKPEQQVTTYTRQAGTNLVLSQTDPLGRQTAYTYDALGNVSSLTRAAGTALAATTTFTYEPTFNQVTSVTDPLNHTTTLAYDSLGNLTTVTNPLGQPTTFTYNLAGQPASVTDPLGNTTRFTYDAGDLVSVTDPMGNPTTRFLDAMGRLSILTDPLGRQTRYDYDPLNRLIRVTNPLAGMVNFGYDANGNLQSVTDARGNATTYAYDNMDRLASRTDPLLHAESYVYDPVGNLTKFTNRKSQATTTTYDALNRRTKVTYGDLSSTTYTWDKGNRLTKVVDSLGGTITRTYDSLDRLTKAVTPQGTVSYTYDAAGRRTSMTVAAQPTVTYTYNNGNRLTQITKGTSTVTMAYDAAGQRTSLTLPNGVEMGYAYDAASRITGIAYKHGATVLGDLTYTYDAVGDRTQVAGSFARSGLPQPVAGAIYNAANQQLTFGAQTLTYDLNGNLTGDGVHTYTWNARNQLTGITGAGLAASFKYDAFGRRTTKTIGGTATTVLSDGITAVHTSGVVANFLTGLGVDEYFTRTDTAGLRAFLTDALGSTLALTDSTGTVQTQYTYEPFGKVTISGLSSTNPFQYTGRENDGTGLYYYRARYYHPGLQRFIAEDPIGFRGGDANLHAYVRGNPVTFTDPTGLALCSMDLPGLEGAYVDDSIAPLIADFIGRNAVSGTDARFSSAWRSTERQGNLGPGATTPAPPGTSLHEAGLAVDIGNWSLLSPASQAMLRENAAAAGLNWGGYFTRPDPVHFYKEVPGGMGNRGSYIDRAQQDAKSAGSISPCTGE